MSQLPLVALHPQDVPDLICFWDFATGTNRLTSKGAYAYTLEERNGPILSVEEGIFGKHSLRIERGQWLSIQRVKCPALNLTGESEVSIVAWVKRESEAPWQYIAGVWNERDSLRQYALFTGGLAQTDHRTMERTPAANQVHGYVSEVGGATQGKPYCFSYATGKQTMELGEWYMTAFTYDRREIRVFLDGELDENGSCNPFLWNQPIFDPGANGADFTVAQRALPAWPHYPEQEAPPHHEGFGGLLGGLAVYKRALKSAEIRALHTATFS